VASVLGLLCCRAFWRRRRVKEFWNLVRIAAVGSSSHRNKVPSFTINRLKRGTIFQARVWYGPILSIQLSKPCNATHSARPMGQSGGGHRLPQPGQLTIRGELLGYCNNNNNNNNENNNILSLDWINFVVKPVLFYYIFVLSQSSLWAAISQ